MKKILIYSLGHNIYDDRVYYKQAISLSKEFMVTLYSSNSVELNKVDENNINLLGKSGSRILNLFKGVFYGIKNKADIYVAHDIDSYFVLVGIKLFRWKAKLIFDSHEYYDLYDKGKLNFLGKIFFFIFLRIVKPISQTFFNGLIIVTSDMGKYYKIDNKEIIYNYPSVSFFNNIKSNNKLDNTYKYFIYHGGISKDRGLFEMLEIFEEYKKINEKIKFLLIGPFYSNELENDFKIKVKKLNLENDIIITGKLTYNETISYIKNNVEKIGFCLFDNVGQMSKTIPIKMLEYLYLDIPQIGSNHINSFNEIISKNNTGISVEYGNIKSELEGIKSIFRNYREYINNCNKIKNNFTWENEEKKLLKFYKNIINEK